MKLTLTALTVAATMFASSASAFENNTTYEEENRMQGKPMVGDLSVGVKALISRYGIGCQRNGVTYLYSIDPLQTDPKEYISYYEIIKQVDGEFTVTYGPAENGDKDLPGIDLPGMSSLDCDLMEEDDPGVTFYPIKSINGFTDRRSFIIDLINQGYE
tara:strand:+ start:998 stop:1471 length:474 start_codon:yes stop_codon:yes gene_type:complete